MERSRAWMRPAVLGAATCLAVAIGGCGGGGAHTSATIATPRGDFVGVYSDDLFFGDDAYRSATLPKERAAGVEIIRQPFRWVEFAKSPAPFDTFVGAAARAGIRVLPTILGPDPGEPDTPPMAPPKDPNAFAGYAAALVRRYGPGGSFWSANPDVPKLPITSWEIWNEPNIPSFWSTGPNAAEYTRLLRVTAAAIRAVDPHAEIVSGGLPTSEGGVPAPDFLEGIYRAGGKGSFDTVGVHPYAATPQQVEQHVKEIADVVARNHDSAGLWVTEVGWATGGKPGPFTVSPQRQASDLTATMRWFGAHHRDMNLRGFVIFQWRDPKPFPGRPAIWPYYAGLLSDDGTPKPALAAFHDAAAQLER